MTDPTVVEKVEGRAARGKAPNGPTVRQAARDTERGDWGTDAPGEIVSLFREALQTDLRELGLQSRLYAEKGEGAAPRPVQSRSTRIDLTEAFFREGQEFRKEALLIDDGGRRCDNAAVLTVAVRDPAGENVDLVRLLTRNLMILGVFPGHALRPATEMIRDTEKQDFDTAVYRIRRIPRPSFGGRIEQSKRRMLDRLTELLGPRKPAPFPR